MFNRLGEGRIVVTNFKLLICVVDFFQYMKLMKGYHQKYTAYCFRGDLIFTKELTSKMAVECAWAEVFPSLYIVLPWVMCLLA